MLAAPEVGIFLDRSLIVKKIYIVLTDILFWSDSRVFYIQTICICTEGFTCLFCQATKLNCRRLQCTAVSYLNIHTAKF